MRSALRSHGQWCPISQPENQVHVVDMLGEVRRAFPCAVVRDHGIDLGVVASATTADARSTGIGQARITRTGDVRIVVGGRWWMASCADVEATRNVLWLISRGMRVVSDRHGCFDD